MRKGGRVYKTYFSCQNNKKMHFSVLTKPQVHFTVKLCLCPRFGLLHCVSWIKKVWIFFLLQLDKVNGGSLGKLGFEREDCFFSLHSYNYSAGFTSPPTALLCASTKLRWLCNCQFHCTFPADPLACLGLRWQLRFLAAYTGWKVMDVFFMSLHAVWWHMSGEIRWTHPYCLYN